MNDMKIKSEHDRPILITGAAGAIGGIGRTLTAMLLEKGHRVRALVRRQDERADDLRRLGAEVVQGDLTDLASMHRQSKAARAFTLACLYPRLISRPRSTSPRLRDTMASKPS
jgi:nucleoside-diphosphate-sugar epimerase